MDDRTRLNGQAVAGERLDDWRYVRGALYARFSTGNFVAGLDFASAVTWAAEAADHHPDLDLRYPHVDLKLLSHDVGCVTRRDVRLARTISSIAADRGLLSDPTALSVLEVGLDTPDAAAIKPFWAAVLGLDPDLGGDDEMIDPDSVIPTLWFQKTEPHEEPRQRFHLDLSVTPELVEPRISAALAAGGTLVSDASAPRYWILADPQGNKICLCTWQGRP